MRHANNIGPLGMELINDAITFAAVTGSVGSTYQVNNFRDSGLDEYVTVARVALGHAAAWRVTDASIDPAFGFVFVREGNPGQYARHEAVQA